MKFIDTFDDEFYVKRIWVPVVRNEEDNVTFVLKRILIPYPQIALENAKKRKMYDNDDVNNYYHTDQLSQVDKREVVVYKQGE